MGTTKRLEEEQEKQRLERIIIRRFLQNVIAKLGDWDDDGSIHYPGISNEIFETDYDGATNSVRFQLVTRSEFREWLRELAPGRGQIHISPKGTTAQEATGWYAECDDCGIVSEGLMTPEDHDRVVRDWYTHDKEKHGGDGNIPSYMLIKS